MKKIIITISLVASVVNATAQVASDAGTNELQTNATEEAVPLKHALIKNSYSPFKTKIGNFLTKLSLTSTFNAGENARADLSYATNKDSDLVVGMSVNQRIGKTSQSATPFDLSEGLTNGTTVGFNLSYIHWKPKLSGRAFADFDKSANSYATRKGIDRRTVTYNDIRDNGNSNEKKLLPGLKTPVFFNLNIAFSKTSFSYATDSVTLAEKDVNHIEPAINFSVGILCSVSSYLAFSYSYSKEYIAADDISFSSPFGTSGNFINQTLAFGAPQKQTDNRVSVQWSKIFGQSSLIGIVPTFTYGFTSKSAALTLPVYFIKGSADGKPNGLQGGIQLGYLTSTAGGSLTSFKDGFGAQLIIGIPLDVFAGLR